MASTGDGSIVLSVTIDQEGLRGEISSLKSQLESGISGLQNFSQSLDAVNQSAERLNQTLDTTNKRIGDFGNITNASSQLMNLGNSLQQNAEAEQRVGDNAERVNNTFNQMNNTMTQNNETVNVFNSYISNTETNITQMSTAVNQSTIQVNTFERAAKTATSTIKKLASQLGIIVSLRQFIKFSNEASESAAQTEANLKRMSALYGEASKSVIDFTTNNAAALGMSVESAYDAAASYGNLFVAFADGADSAKLTTAMLQTTAVIASQTGRTYEDVFEKIRSGLYGNTRAIDDLGISVRKARLTQTEAYETVTGGVKKWNDLTDAELQAARALGIIEQSQKLYGNTVLQTSALTRSQFNAAWADFKATWGVAVNQILMPVLKWLTLMLRYAQILLKVLFNLDISASASSSIDYKGISAGVDGLSDSQKDLTKSTKNLKKETKELNKELAEFDELAILSQKENGIDDTTTPSTGAGGTSVDLGGIDLGDIDTILDDDTLQKLQEFEQWVTDHKEAIKTALEIAGLGILGLAVGNVAKKIGNLLGLFKKKDNALDTQTNKTNTETSAVNAMSYAFSLVPALAYGVAYGLNKLGQGATDTVPALDGVTASAYGTVPAFEGATQGAYGAIPALDGVTASAYGTVPAFEGAGQSVTAYGTVVDTVMPQTETTAQKALNNTEKNADSYSTTTKTTFSDWATSVATNVNAVATVIGTGMYVALDSAGQNINSFVEQTSQEVRDWAKSVGDNFVSAAKTIANSMATSLSSAYENWKEFKQATGEKTSTFWQKHGATITAVAIAGAITAGAIALAPYTGGVSLAAVGLANGAVLPPNQPFLAMVGDQKHGTNIEAPAELIREMVEDALDSRGLTGGQQQQVVKEEHYYLNRQKLMSVIYELAQGGEKLKGTSLINRSTV